MHRTEQDDRSEQKTSAPTKRAPGLYLGRARAGDYLDGRRAAPQPPASDSKKED